MSYNTQYSEQVFKSAEKRIRKLFEDLKQLDSRFSYEDDLGYIRFNTNTRKSEFVVSWVYSGMSLRLKPCFGIDGEIDGFNSLYSNYDETCRNFNWLAPETHLCLPNWKEDLEKECKLIYDSMVNVLQEEAKMKHGHKIWEIRRAANVFC